MADWAISYGGRVESHNPTGWGADVTSHTSANTKGAYAEVRASTLFEADKLVFTLSYTNAEAYSFLVDIAVGAAGSEVVIVPDLLVTSGAGQRECCNQEIPINIAVGSRLSCRCQAYDAGGKVIGVVLQTIKGNILSPGGLGAVTAYGAVTGDSGGTPINGGGTAGVKGAYAELSASCLNINGFFIRFGKARNTAPQWQHGLIDIAVGSAGSEVVIVPDIILTGNTLNTSFNPQVTIFYPISIPAGTRLSARWLCSNNDATDRIADVVLYGIG